MRRRGWHAFLVAAALAAAPLPAGAVIKVDMPVAKIYASATAVMAGTIVVGPEEDRPAEARVTRRLKGEAAADRFRIQLAALPDLARQVGPDRLIVVFARDPRADGTAVVHVADTWALAQAVPQADPPTWRVVGPYDGARSFPGRTSALVRIVEEIAAGRTPLQDWVSHEAFLKGPRAVGTLGVKPTFLAGADVNADGRLDLVVGTAAGVRLFLAASDGYADATASWGLAGAPAHRGAVGDVDGDGRPDLLLDRFLWLHRGERFARGDALPLDDPSAWLAVTLDDATGDARPDAAVLLRSGTLVVAENPGTPGKPWSKTVRALWSGHEAAVAAFSSEWGDDGRLYVLVVSDSDITRYPADPRGSPAADFRRLTGVPLEACREAAAPPFRVLMAVALDYDGLGRPDFMIVTEDGGLTLVNRGFGAFLVNAFLHRQFHATPEEPLKWTPPYPFRLSPARAVAPGRIVKAKRRRQNLLVLTEDGRLFELDNPQE